MRFRAEAFDELIELEAETGSNLVAELIGEYLVTLPRLVSQIEAAFSQKNDTQLGLCSHSLKSSSRLLGLDLVSEHCAAIEDAVREGRPTEPIIAKLKEELAPAVAALTDFLNSRKRG